MRPRLIAWLLLALLAYDISAAGQEVRRFEVGSYAQIRHSQEGRPFLLALWSVTCAPCYEELEMLGKLLKKQPQLRLVLVSTDASVPKATVLRTLERYEVAGAQNWVFADDYVEQLRFEIDPKWRGELPRTYFFHGDGSVRALSGKLEAKAVEAWLASVR